MKIILQAIGTILVVVIFSIKALVEILWWPPRILHYIREAGWSISDTIYDIWVSREDWEQ